MGELGATLEEEVDLVLAPGPTKPNTLTHRLPPVYIQIAEATELKNACADMHMKSCTESVPLLWGIDSPSHALVEAIEHWVAIHTKGDLNLARF